MRDDPAYALTLQLLQEVGEALEGAQHSMVLRRRDSVVRLLTVEDDNDAQEVAHELLRDALSR